MENDEKYKEEIVEHLKDCKYTREEIIDVLVSADKVEIDHFSENILDILMSGCKGYNDYTLSELKDEHNRRFDEQI